VCFRLILQSGLHSLYKLQNKHRSLRRVSKTAFSGVWRQILKKQTIKDKTFYRVLSVNHRAIRARRILPNEITSLADLSNLSNSRIDVLADFNQQQ